MSALILFWLLFCVLVPGMLCRLMVKKPLWFATVRQKLLFVLIYSALSWLLTNGLWFIPYQLGWLEIRGPEAGMAVTSGWLYLWITSLPMLLIFTAYRRIAAVMTEKKQTDNIPAVRIAAVCLFLLIFVCLYFSLAD